MAAKKKVSKTQIQIFVEYFEKHEILRTGKLTPNMAPNTLYELWQEISQILNNCGFGAVREADRWKTTFVEWKSQVKKRARDGKELTDIEKRFLKALGVAVIEGIQNVPEIGLPPVSVPDTVPNDQINVDIENIPMIIESGSINNESLNEKEAGAAAEIHLPTASTSERVTARKRKPIPKQKNVLLEQYIKGQDQQKEGLQAIAAGLSDIAISINKLADVIKNKGS